VAGDRVYGAPATVEGLPPLGRFFLHAQRVGFEQPSKGVRVTVESPLPPELEAWVGSLIALEAPGGELL
jgi:23S rRNA-/tRNA-specific pseudouridylate synthase